MIMKTMFPPMDQEDREVLLAALSMAIDNFSNDAKIAVCNAKRYRFYRQDNMATACYKQVEEFVSLEKRAKALLESILAILADNPPLEK